MDFENASGFFTLFAIFWSFQIPMRIYVFLELMDYKRRQNDILIYWTFWICALALCVLISHWHIYTYMICLFVFFVWGFSFHSRIVHSYEMSPWPVKGCIFFNLYSALMAIQVLYSEGSLACHTYCDKGLPFIMVIVEDPWHLHLLPSIWQWNCNYLFYRFRSVAAGTRTPNLPHASRTV